MLPERGLQRKKPSNWREVIRDAAGGEKFIIGICATVSALIVGIPCWIVMNKQDKGKVSWT